MYLQGSLASGRKGIILFTLIGMNKTTIKNKKASSNPPYEEIKKMMFLEQLVSLRIVLGWGAAILAFLLPLSYGLGRWMQRIDDKFEVHQKQTELNETRTQLTLEFNEKVSKLEKENTRLETLLEVYKGKEVNDGK